MNYFDGFVCAVAQGNRDAYAAKAREGWTEFFAPMSALAMTECWGDEVPDGTLTSFPMAVRAEAGEVVVFSWVEWPDKPTRDAAWEEIRRLGPEGMGDMPFDTKRMICGGFAPLVAARA